MPGRTDLERRDRAVFALLMLTAVRDGALITLRLKHVDPADRCLWQNAKEVATKFCKSFRTYFLPGYPEAEQVISDWVRYQRETLLRGDATRSSQDCDGYWGGRRVSADRAFPRILEHPEPVRKSVREAFQQAGIRSFGPHRFRDMHARAVLRSGASIEKVWAVSQNLGHSSMITTLGSYGQLPDDRRRELIFDTSGN